MHTHTIKGNYRFPQIMRDIELKINQFLHWLVCFTIVRRPSRATWFYVLCSVPTMVWVTAPEGDTDKVWRDGIKEKKRKLMEKEHQERRKKRKGAMGEMSTYLHVWRNMLNHTPKMILATLEGISLTNYLNLAILSGGGGAGREKLQKDQRPDISWGQASGCLTDCSPGCLTFVGALQMLVSPQKTVPPSSRRCSWGKAPGDLLCPRRRLALQVPGQQPVVTDRSEGGQGDFGDPTQGRCDTMSGWPHSVQYRPMRAWTGFTIKTRLETTGTSGLPQTTFHTAPLGIPSHPSLCFCRHALSSEPASQHGESQFLSPPHNLLSDDDINAGVFSCTPHA